jgi:hypothetical protein
MTMGQMMRRYALAKLTRSHAHADKWLLHRAAVMRISCGLDCQLGVTRVQEVEEEEEVEVEVEEEEDDEDAAEDQLDEEDEGWGV